MLEAVNLGSSSAPERYSPCDPLWRHPRSGGTLFVGNRMMASNRALLREQGITHIVNCQDSDGVNHFEGDPELTYLRFSIGLWRNVPSIRDGADGTWRFWEPYFQFIVDALRDGHNVLVHCLAGAHRAGTAGVAALMLFCSWDKQMAIPAAKKLRPAIDPIGGFPELLDLLERSRTGREEHYRQSLGLAAAGYASSPPGVSATDAPRAPVAGEAAAQTVQASFARLGAAAAGAAAAGGATAVERS